VDWIYKNTRVSTLEDIPTNIFGFIYKITYLPTNKSYIGKKFLTFTRKQKLGKKELKLLEGQKGRPASFKIVQKESDWKTYWSSNKPLKDLVKSESKEDFKREILHYCSSKKQLTYFEIKYQMEYQVLEKPKEFFNDNILGKFFTRDLE